MGSAYNKNSVPNHQCIGEMVANFPGLRNVMGDASELLGCDPAGLPRDVLSPLMVRLHAPTSGFRVLETYNDTSENECELDHQQTAGHYCVTQLRCGSVCVIKLHGKGCSFFVRMKRSQWDEGVKAKAWKQDGLDDDCCALHRKLTFEQGITALFGARAYEVTAERGVHHPHALSVLCNLARNNWLHPVALSELDLPNKDVYDADPSAWPAPMWTASFELLVLPPSPTVVEECFCLLGHKQTFVSDGGGYSDSEDDDMSLTEQIANRRVWGIAHGDRIRSAHDADKFKQATVLMNRSGAGSYMFSKLVPKMNECRHQNDAHVKYAHTLAGQAMRERKEQESRQANMLAPSESEDDGGAATSGSTAPVATPRAVAAPTGANKRKAPAAPRRKPAAAAAKAARVQPKPRAPARPAKDSDDDDEAEAMGSAASTPAPTSEEDNADEARAGWDDDGSELQMSDSASPRSPDPVPPPVAAPVQAAPAPAAPPPVVVAAGLSVDALKAMCQPCCDQLGRFLLSNDGLVTDTRWERLQDDNRLLQDATTVETVVAASLSLARTLMDAHTDPPEGSTVRVSGRERARVRTLAARTCAFAEAALDDVDRAIEESRAQTERLEKLRKRGYDALEAVEGGGFGPGDEQD